MIIIEKWINYSERNCYKLGKIKKNWNINQWFLWNWKSFEEINRIKTLNQNI